MTAPSSGTREGDGKKIGNITAGEKAGLCPWEYLNVSLPQHLATLN